MEWKVRLTAEEATITEMAQAFTTPAAKLTRDGVDWYLESSEFAYFTDHTDVKEKAQGIVGSFLTASTNPQAKIEIGPIVRIHYDNSKSVFR